MNLSAPRPSHPSWRDGSVYRSRNSDRPGPIVFPREMKVMLEALSGLRWLTTSPADWLVSATYCTVTIREPFCTRYPPAGGPPVHRSRWPGGTCRARSFTMKQGVRLLDGPRRREAAGCHRVVGVIAPRRCARTTRRFLEHTCAFRLLLQCREPSGPKLDFCESRRLDLEHFPCSDAAFFHKTAPAA
jgi:hypothetical protein